MGVAIPPALWEALKDAGLVDPAAPTPEQVAPPC
jgi:hypothetical protein